MSTRVDSKISFAVRSFKGLNASDGSRISEREGGGGRAAAARDNMGERCELPHQGLGLRPSRFALFKSQNIA